MKRLQELLKQPAIPKNEVALSPNAKKVLLELERLWKEANKDYGDDAKTATAALNAYYNYLGKLPNAHGDDIESLSNSIVSALAKLGYDMLEEPSTKGTDDLGVVIIKR